MNLTEKIDWIIDDLSFKAPEQIDAQYIATHLSILRHDAEQVRKAAVDEFVECLLTKIEYGLFLQQGNFKWLDMDGDFYRGPEYAGEGADINSLYEYVGWKA